MKTLLQTLLLLCFSSPAMAAPILINGTLAPNGPFPIVDGGFTTFGATQKAVNFADPTLAQDLATKNYIDTFAGSTSITTLGTVTTGTWNATTIAAGFGGTGQTTYTNGQLLIGNTTGNTLTKATLTAGTGITVTNGTGTISLAVNQAASLTWTGTERFNNGIQAQAGIVRATAGTGNVFSDANSTTVIVGSTANSTEQMQLDANGATFTGGRVLADSGFGRATAGQANFGNENNSTSVQLGGGPSVTTTVFGNNVNITANVSTITIDGPTITVLPTGNTLTLATTAATVTLNAATFTVNGATSTTINGGTNTSIKGNSTFTVFTDGAGTLNFANSTNKVGIFNTTAVVQQTVTGVRGDNAALASSLTALANYGWIINNTTAGPAAGTLGSPISSTGVNVTISPTSYAHHVTGVGIIQTINVPYTGFTGTLLLIPDGAFALTTGGNIALAATAVVSKSLYIYFDGTNWYPSYT